MKKDVIYIDIEDDITSIIDKIKRSSNKIVALVPPKRIGALQSAVNLKLLQKAATSANKRVVLITSDVSLGTLAAGVKIPVAKNLQSRPELVTTLPVADEDGDVIKGEDLPIGELARMSPEGGVTDDELNKTAPLAAAAVGATAAAQNAKKAKASDGFKGKIPNFDTFRKKLFLIGGLGALLIVFLVWAFMFAPRATVTITANTNAVSINQPLNLDPNQATAPELARIAPEIKQIKKTASSEFDTTGTKEIGQRATTSLSLSNSDGDEATIPAGTTFSAQGLQFTTDSPVTVPKATVCQRNVVCPGTASVKVTAASIGTEYNIPAQSYTSNTDLTATGEAATGGSKETVAVVAQADIDKAVQQLESQNSASVRDELSKQFTGNVIIINESFKSEPGQPTAAPGVGEQAKRARVSAETVYTLVALSRDDMDDVLKKILEKQIDGDSTRRIYTNGSKSLRFTKFEQASAGTYTVQMSTTGYIGPTINEDQLKQQIAGKRYGEIEQLVNNINGVQHVDIKFSPFWVTKAPQPDKVTIQFTVKNNADQ